MDVLTRYGFTFEELNYMLESNDDINKLNESDIYEKIDILGQVGCMSDHIKNIFLYESSFSWIRLSLLIQK